MEEPIFWSQFEMIEENKKDLIKSMEKGELFPIISELDGGIIAYAIGEKHAELIVDCLNNMTM